MNNLNKIFNVNSDREYYRLMESFDLHPQVMFLIEDIAFNGLDVDTQRNQILSVLALNSDEAYLACKEQFSKRPSRPFKRTLKEAEQAFQELSLNDVMELNELVELVAKKCKNDKIAYQQLYQMLLKATSKNIANAFFNIAFNAENTDDNLKFNTDIVIDGKNLAQTIFPLKNSITSLLNSIKEPSKAVSESVQIVNEESLDNDLHATSSIIDNIDDVTTLEKIVKMIDERIINSRSTGEKNAYNTIKTNIIGRINKLKKNGINECIASNVVSAAVEEDTFDNMLNDLAKPTVINITVNKENGDLTVPEPSEDCCEDSSLINGVKTVQPVNISPNAIDAPQLRKPNQAMVASALSALSSHMNDVKSDSRENNLECLQTINTLLQQISDYFNNLLSESHNRKENGYRSAGFLNVKTNEIQWLKEGDTHSGKKTLKEFDDGWVRFGVAPTKKDFYCYVSSTNKAYFNNAIKVLNNVLSENLDYYQLEHFTDNYIDASRCKVSPNGKPLWESKYSPVLPKNVKRMLESGRATINNDGVLVIDEALLEARQHRPFFTYTFEAPDNQYLEFNGYKIGENSYDVDFLNGDYNYIATAEFTTDGAVEDTIEKSLLKKGYSENDWNIIEKEIINRINIANEDNQLNEETVYDRSWFEVEDGDYPKFTEDGVIIEDEQVDETCSAGATCAANVATIAQPVGKKKKRTVSEQMVVDMILSGNDVATIYKDCLYEFKNGYFYKNHALIQTKNPVEMVAYMEGEIDLPVLEGFLPEQMEMLLEDINSEQQEMSDMNLTPEQRQLKQKQEQNLDAQIQSGNEMKVSIEDEKDKSKLTTNQELVGVDDSDINNKKYVVKDPSTRKIKIVKSDQIKTDDQMNQQG